MKIILLEDNPRDATLVQAMLEPIWPQLELQVATSRDEFISALSLGDCDLVLSDFNLPGFSGRDALLLSVEQRPEVPFLFLSGTIGEETAVEMVRCGAADYLLKDRMQRLPIAIRRALTENQERRRRLAAERQMREQAELLDKVQDGIVVTSLRNRILYWNYGAERMFGWPTSEVVGKSMGDVFGSAAEAAYTSMNQQLPATEEWRGELALSNRDQRQLLADVRVTVIRDTEGKPVSRLSIISDVTERKKLEEQLLRTQRLESLGMLAAGIAHDLNNALAPMLMAGGLLRSRVTDPADIRLVELLEQSAARGAALVKQILSFAGGKTRDRVLIQPKHIIRDVLQLMEDTFPKSIRLEQDLAQGLSTIAGDPTQLHQVLLNLCINARDAMPEGGVLRLKAENQIVTPAVARSLPGGIPGNFVVIETADTGSGIQPEILKRIWEPFFTTKAEGKGTGLGLSTVRGIVVGHGGFVTVSSSVGVGTTFRVYLPARIDIDAAASKALSSSETAGKGQGQLVFVVDDQASIRESIASVLLANGYRPVTISDGIEALSKYADRVPDVALVVTDIDMPGLNGIAFAQAMVHLNPAASILFISGTGDPAETKRFGGATTRSAFLAKPFSPEVLLAAVDGLLGKKVE